jgi:hypothetical protein
MQFIPQIKLNIINYPIILFKDHYSFFHSKGNVNFYSRFVKKKTIDNDKMRKTIKSTNKIKNPLIKNATIYYIKNQSMN